MSELSEEEKKSIEELQKELRLAKNIGNITTSIRNEYAEKIIDLIEKLKKKTKKCEYYEMVADELSKELEELKDKFSDEKIRDTVIKRYREVIEKDYVGKDKIKAKIEELEHEKEKYFEKQVIQHEIEVLQSLLEEE